jgi:hypothetical protein
VRLGVSSILARVHEILAHRAHGVGTAGTLQATTLVFDSTNLLQLLEAYCWLSSSFAKLKKIHSGVVFFSFDRSTSRGSQSPGVSKRVVGVVGQSSVGHATWLVMVG